MLIGLRRVGNICKFNGNFVIPTDYYKLRGIHKIYVDFIDDHCLIIEYTPRFDNCWSFIQTQSLNAVSGYKWTLILVYNQRGAFSGKEYFHIVNNAT
ncbi:hypothetical protein [Photorhabdus kleinii]|uniref:hypothetical protein n=1 Tax=Photorhabdus kleinii TaxID=768034 RepID=UPI0021D49356|nr:hypothetical protein [Photorhabdus kleinii]